MESQEESEGAWCEKKGDEGNSRVCCSGGVKITKEAVGVRGTTKAEILKCDPKCSDLIATIVCDTKPVHYLRMSSDKLKWIVCEKDVYNVDTGTK